MYQTTFQIHDEELINYLASCARIRKTSKRYLLHKVVQAVLRDQLILSILDDESKIIPRQEWHAFAATDIIEGQEVT